ncbi:uncharacterized protein TNCV_4970041 [Trichonephila clavipes]|nr:uncharacterized protein TNCV_4970041 [Trichonephila clavipes]
MGRSRCQRMDEDLTTKKVFNAQPIGTRKKGRLNLRWTDGLEKDLLALRTKTWRRLTCKRLLENVNTLPGLSRH